MALVVQVYNILSRCRCLVRLRLPKSRNAQDDRVRVQQAERCSAHLPVYAAARPYAGGASARGTSRRGSAAASRAQGARRTGARRPRRGPAPGAGLEGGPPHAFGNPKKRMFAAQRQKASGSGATAGAIKSDLGRGVAEAMQGGRRARRARARLAARRRRWRGVNRQTVTGANTGGNRRSRRSRRRYCTPYPADQRAASPADTPGGCLHILPGGVF